MTVPNVFGQGGICCKLSKSCGVHSVVFIAVSDREGRGRITFTWPYDPELTSDISDDTGHRATKDVIRCADAKDA